ncbi:MAG TPA: tetratricopeptide repeat protein [Gemmatimonadales bacterium]|jgi:tetratricopeptide (TPR) repeat protein
MQRSSPLPPIRRFTLQLGAVLVLASIAFAPALTAPFVFDDQNAVQRNSSIQHLWPLSGPLSPSPHTATSGRPVANLSLAIDQAIGAVVGVGGSNATVVFHVTNLLLHLATALLLFGIIRRTLQSARLAERWRARADGLALAITAAWIIHPLQTDAVDYITQRTELLMGFCFIATVYASIRAWEAHDHRWYVVGVIACALGMGSKEVMIAAPLVVVLYDRAFRLDAWHDLTAPLLRNRRRFYACLAATWGILIALQLGQPRGAWAGLRAPISWLAYLTSQGWIITRYLGLAIWPARLTIDYGSRPITGGTAVPGLVVIAILLVATIVTWFRADRLKPLAFLGVWFLAILAPSSSIVPIATEIGAERRMYLPLAAVIVLLVIGAVALTDWIRDRKQSTVTLPAIAPACGAIAVVALAACTFRRSETWRQPEELWRGATVVFRNNARAWYNLGVAIAERNVARADEADADYRHALALDSTYADATLRVAANDFVHRRYGDADSILGHYPRGFGNDTLLVALSGAFLASGDTTAALISLRRAASMEPRVETLLALGQLDLMVRRTDDAIIAFQQAAAVDPSRDDLLGLIGGLLLQEHQALRAVPVLEELTRRQPGAGSAHALLSLAYADAGRVADAMQEAEKGVALGDHDERVLFFAARAMLDAHSLDSASAYLGRAIALNGNDADVLAAEGDLALARHQNAAAINWFERALAIDPSNAEAIAGLRRAH